MVSFFDGDGIIYEAYVTTSDVSDIDMSEVVYVRSKKCKSSIWGKSVI